jgi:hypothetical protein
MGHHDGLGMPSRKPAARGGMNACTAKFAWLKIGSKTRRWRYFVPARLIQNALTPTRVADGLVAMFVDTWTLLWDLTVPTREERHNRIPLKRSKNKIGAKNQTPTPSYGNNLHQRLVPRDSRSYGRQHCNITDGQIWAHDRRTSAHSYSKDSEQSCQSH